MSASVPPDTETYVDAVTYGYHGRRTDPYPDDDYDVEGGGAPSVVSLSSLVPDHAALGAAPGDIKFVGSGMLTEGLSARLWFAGDANYTQTGIVAATDDAELTATFPTAPQGAPAGAGSGVLLLDDKEVSGRVPFTWDLPPRNYVSHTPLNVSLAAAASGFDLVCTGTFPDDASALEVNIAQPNMGGTTIVSSSITKDSLTQLTAHFDAPTGMVAGSAQVYIGVPAEQGAYPGSSFVTFDP